MKRTARVSSTRPGGAIYSGLRGTARLAELEEALARGARVHWYWGEDSRGWLRTPGAGAVMFVDAAEVAGCYRRLLARARG